MAGEAVFGWIQPQINRAARSFRVTEGRNSSSGEFSPFGNSPIYAKITEIVSSTENHEAKGTQVYYNLDDKEWITAPNGWRFDEDDDTAIGQKNIYSDADLSVDDIIEVVLFQDSTEREQWYGKKAGGGGVQRPLIRTAGFLAFGAELESIVGQAIKTEFTETQSFRALLPWGETVILPDDYVFTADVDSSGTYYTEVFPNSMFVKPLESYPAATGITQFVVYESGIDTSLELYNTATATTLFKLILADFDFVNASTPAKAYYSGKMFPVSFSLEDNAFYFISPLVG